MQYYKLAFNSDIEKDEDAVCYSDEDFMQANNIKPNDIHLCEYLSPMPSPLPFTFESSKGNEFNDVVPNDNAWFIISNRIRDALQEAECTNVSFVPVSIKDLDTDNVYNNYSLLLVNNYVDALDLDNSDYNIFRTKDIEMLSITKYALNEERCNNLDFICIEKSKYATFISKKVADILDNSKCVGFGLIRVKMV